MLNYAWNVPENKLNYYKQQKKSDKLKKNKIYRNQKPSYHPKSLSKGKLGDRNLLKQPQRQIKYLKQTEQDIQITSMKKILKHGKHKCTFEQTGSHIFVYH